MNQPRLAVDAITFDLDDTLWDNKPVISKAIFEAEQFLSEANSKGTIEPERLHAAKAHTLKRQPQLEFDLTSLRYETYLHALHLKGVGPSEAKAIATQAIDLFMQLRARVEPFDDAIDTLTQLASKFRLGAISNGNCPLNTLAIGQLFEFWITPLEAQAAKPSTAIYSYAEQTQTLNPATTLHVGDCLTNDVWAAKQAGYLTAWFNPQQRKQPHEATIEIACLSDLPNHLQV